MAMVVGRWRTAIVSLACALLVLSACTTSSTGTPNAPAAVDTSNLVIGTAGLGAQDFTPWLASDEIELITGMIGETLTRINPTTQALEPGLAESWTLSPDLKTWTFKLRPNTPFQGGWGNVTSEDVKFSFDQWINKKESTQPQQQFYRLAVDDNLDKNFVIVSPTEFKLVTNSTPINYFATAASNVVPGIPIQSKKYWEANPQKALTAPLGSGPWEFVSQTPGVELKLKAVQGHYRGTPAFKQVTWRIIKDDAARLSALRTGEIDMAPISPTLLGEAKAAGVKIQSVKDVGTVEMILGGNYYDIPEAYDRAAPWIQADAPEKGLAIRQAMSYAVDRKAIIDKIVNGEGTPTHAPDYEFPTNKQLVDPSWTLPEYNVAKAKESLAKGGYPNGFDVAAWIYDDYPASRQIQEATYGMLEAVGIKVKREIVDYNTVIRPAIRKPFTGTKGHIYTISKGWKPETVQAVGNSGIPQATTSYYRHPALLPAYNAMANEADLTKRYSLARDLLSKLRDSMYAIPFYTSTFPVGIGKKVGSWTPIPSLEKITNVESVTPPK